MILYIKLNYIILKLHFLFRQDNIKFLKQKNGKMYKRFYFFYSFFQINLKIIKTIFKQNKRSIKKQINKVYINIFSLTNVILSTNYYKIRI